MSSKKHVALKIIMEMNNDCFPGGEVDTKAARVSFCRAIFFVFLFFILIFDQ